MSEIALTEIVPVKSNKYKRPEPKTNVIKIRKDGGGQMRFTAPTIEALQLTVDTFIVFASDGESLYFRLEEEPVENARPIRLYTAKSGSKVAYVSISSVLRALNLNVEDIQGRHIFHYDEETGCYKTTIQLLPEVTAEEK